MINWKWFGNAGHLIVSRDCQFHLCTKIGRYLISTVGQYFPGEATREIFAKHRGITLEGIGDARTSDYMKKIGFEDIGCDRKYETMVFKAGAPCKRKGCDCGIPSLLSAMELDMRSYNNAGDATKGHMAMCKKWAKKK